MQTDATPIRTDPEPIELPGMFVRADHVAVAAQRRYLRLRGLDLGLLIVSAAFAALSPDGLRAERAVAAGVFGFMLVSLTMTFVVQRLRPERRWFDGRVVAESVKTLSYRYMARAEPYDGAAVSADVDDRFVRDLAKVAGDRARWDRAFGGAADAGSSITASMRRHRGLDLSARKSWYLEERIRSQADWYAAKAITNEYAARRWFVVTAVAKVATLAAAVVLIWQPLLLIKPAGFFGGLASAALAWNQLRQHQTLAQTYGLATQELRSVLAAAHGIDTDADFSTYVADAENAISREHILWRARRDRAGA